MKTKNTLPKQWKHWLAAAKLRPYGKAYDQARNPVYNFIGRGRHWRINCHGHFQVSEVYEDFDRWANSVRYTIFTTPKTRKEFIDNVNFLLKRAERKERLIKHLCKD